MSTGASILVATDFSPYARHAADRAARLAREWGSRLTLLHLLAGPGLVPAWLRDATSLKARVMEARQQLEPIVARVRSGRDLDVEAVVRDRTVLAGIVDQAECMNAQLVVVGARGASFMRRLALGTTAERLVRKITRPVLVVRQTPRERYGRVMVGVDFSDWSLGALEAARSVAPHAHLMVATVFAVPYQDRMRMAGVDGATLVRYREQARADATRQLHALVGAAGLRRGQWEPCVVEGDPAFKLLELEQQMDCDLLVVGKQGTSTAVDLLVGSVTNLLIAEASGDVLVSTRRAG